MNAFWNLMRNKRVDKIQQKMKKKEMEAERARKKPRKQKKRNEIQEIKDDLNSKSIATKQKAIRKIIGAMTLGKDVSVLFPYIVKNMETPDLKLKKLIYLYIINYARIHTELAILATNTFQKGISKISHDLDLRFRIWDLKICFWKIHRRNFIIVNYRIYLRSGDYKGILMI